MLQRNEILESGQITILYRNGFWEGEMCGYATLDKLFNASPRTVIETWIVILPDGQKRQWSMHNPDKKVRQNNVCDAAYEPF